jgi:hypothetical protein
MLDKVRKILGLSSPKTGNKIVISVEKLERRVALLENGNSKNTASSVTPRATL